MMSDPQTLINKVVQVLDGNDFKYFARVIKVNKDNTILVIRMGTRGEYREIIDIKNIREVDM